MARPRLLRRALRIVGLALLWVVVVLVILVTVTLDILQRPVGLEQLRRLALRQTRPLLPGLQLGRIDGDITSTLTLDRVVLNDRFGGQAIRVRCISLRYDLTGLPGELRVERLELDRPELVIKPSKNGELNLSQLVVPQPATEPSSESTKMRLRLDRLRIIGGSVQVAGTRVSGIDVDLSLKGSLDRVSLVLSGARAQVQLPDGKKLGGQVSGRLSLDRSRIDARFRAGVNGLVPADLQLDLAARGPLSRVGLDARLALAGGGALTVDGWVGWGEQCPRYDLRLGLSDMDLARLAPSLPPTRIDLRLGAAGHGVPLQPGSRAKLTLRAPAATVAGYRIESLKIDAETDDGRWKLGALVLEAAGGRVKVAGAGTLERVDVKARVDLPRLDRLPDEVRRLAPPRLGGAVALTAHVVGPIRGPLTLQSRLGVRRLAVAGVRVGRADLAAGFSGLPAAPRGKLELTAAHIDPPDRRFRMDRVRLAVSGTPRRLHLACAADGPGLRGQLEADTTIHDGGKRVEVELRRLALAGLGRRVTLRNEPRLLYHDGRRIELTTTRLAVLGGEVTVEGVIRPRGFPRLEAQLRVHGVRPPGLARPVDAAITARADRREVHATVEASLPSLGTRLAVAARLPVRYRALLPLPDLRRDGQVKLRLERLRLGLLSDVSRDLPRASGQVDLTLDVGGKLVDPQVDLALKLTDAGLGEVQGVDASTELAVRGGSTHVRHQVSLAGRPLVGLTADVPLTLAPLLTGAAGVERLRDLPVKIRLDLHRTRISALPRIHPALSQIDGEASARLEVDGPLLRPSLRFRSRLTDAVAGGTMKLGAIDTRVTTTAGNGAIRATVDVDRDRQPLLRAQGSAKLELGSLLGRRLPLPAIPISLDARVPAYSLARLEGVNSQLAGLAGLLSARIRVSGTTRARRGRAEFRVAQAGYDKVQVGDLGGELSFDGKQLSSRLDLRQPGGGLLRWSGFLSTRGLAGRLVGSRLDLAFLKRLSPEIKESAGRLAVDLKASGSLARPVVTGYVALKEGKLHPRGMSQLHHINARMELGSREVRLVRLGLKGDKGTLDLSGRVTLAGEGLDLSLGPRMVKRIALLARARGFGVDAGPMTGVVFSADVKVNGEVGKRLVLKVNVEHGMVKVPKIEGQRQLLSTAVPSDVVFVDQQAGVAAVRPVGPPRARGLGLQLELGADPLFVRGEEVDLEVVTNLRVRTDELGRPRVRGRVEIRRGRIRALNNTFEVRQAVVSFSGEADPDPALNVVLARTAPEAIVIVQLSGTASAPELTLRSEPPVYEQSQIISLLLTGRIDARPDSGGSGDQTTAIASALSQVLLGNLVRRIAPKVGIDVARVSFDESKDERTGESQLKAEAEVGKFITERLYVGYRRVFGASATENANEGLMEYRISARWLLMALFGDAGVGGLDLVWNLRY